jgi:hypothetical protein
MMNLSFDESLNSWIADILQNRVITWGVTKSLSLRIYPRYICTNPLGFNRSLSTLVHATSIDHIINSLHTKNVEWEMLKMSILLHFRKKIVLHVMYVLEKDEKNKSNRRNLLVSGKCARTRGEWTTPNQTKSSHVITLTNMITKWQKCTLENSTVYVCHTRTSTSTYPLPRRVPPRVAGDTGICWVTVTQRNTMWMSEWEREIIRINVTDSFL